MSKTDLNKHTIAAFQHGFSATFTIIKAFRNYWSCGGGGTINLPSPSCFNNLQKSADVKLDLMHLDEAHKIGAS